MCAVLPNALDRVARNVCFRILEAKGAYIFYNLFSIRLINDDSESRFERAHPQCRSEKTYSSTATVCMRLEELTGGQVCPNVLLCISDTDVCKKSSLFV